MTQLSILPTVICQRTKPPPATAAADFIGVDQPNAQYWLCKGQTKHHGLPATEWICSHLAGACGLPVPPVAVVELQAQPGISYFGSQWQGGAKEFLDVMGRITNPDVFERTHAVDLFVHNTDRHRGNYLYLDLAGDIVARVIDFSHAWLVMGWPLPVLPMGACNTVSDLHFLLAQNTSPYLRPTVMLERIAQLPNTWMQNTLAAMPSHWLDQPKRDAFDNWWQSTSRHDRLNEAKLALP